MMPKPTCSFHSLQCCQEPVRLWHRDLCHGLHRSATNLEVAKLENAAILKEENYAGMYEGFDPNLDEDYITLSMFQDAFLEQSTLLAEEVQQQFREGLSSRTGCFPGRIHGAIPDNHAGNPRRNRIYHQ